MAQAKSKQAKIVEQAVVAEAAPEAIEQLKEIVETAPVVESEPEEQRVEAFYYNHNPHSEVRNTFDVYFINSTTGCKVRVKQDLYIAEAREAVHEINKELGIDRIERIYNL